jgi:protein TonB
MSRKTPIAWDKDRGLFLKIGMAVSLCLVLLAFNWTVDPQLTPAEDQLPEDGLLITIMEPPRTNDPIPPAPPPPPEPLADPVIDPRPVPAKPAPIIDPEPITPGPVYKKYPIDDPVLPPAPLPPPTERPVDDGPHIVVEVMPRFPGCEDINGTKADKEQCANQAVLEFIYDHVRYPSLARDAGIEGLVVVQFVVEKDGSISNVKAIRDIGGGCGAEAIRVVHLMPDWIPGRQQGLPVRVQYNLPIRFQLMK